MINSVYTYNTRVLDGYQVNDYTSFYYGGLIELFKQYADYFTSYEAEIDQKVEEISYELYKSVDYADFILASNNDVFLWNMSYNTDIVLDQASSLQTIIKNELNDFAQSSEDLIDVFNNITNNTEILNTNKIVLTVPKPEKLNALLSIVETYRKNNAITLEEPEVN